MKKFSQIVVFAGALALAPVLAAQTFGSSGGGENQQAFDEARQTVMQLGQKLTEIEEAAVEENPELQQKREELQKLLMKTMTEQGAKPQERIERLQELQPKLSGSGAAGGDREELMQEFREQQKALMEAQNKALQVPEVREARQELQQETFAAMKEIDPETEKLVKQLREAQQRAQELQGGAGGLR
jgi:inhibitor of KinA sporulation pathway (predicted exonuclease)